MTKTKLKKGDRVRLMKDARRRLQDTLSWRRNPDRCDGIGEIVAASAWAEGEVTVKFPKAMIRMNPKLLEPAQVR